MNQTVKPQTTVKKVPTPVGALVHVLKFSTTIQNSLICSDFEHPPDRGEASYKNMAGKTIGVVTRETERRNRKHLRSSRCVTYAYNPRFFGWNQLNSKSAGGLFCIEEVGVELKDYLVFSLPCNLKQRFVIHLKFNFSRNFHLTSRI